MQASDHDIELLTELVQTLTNDVSQLKQLVVNQPQPTAPPDLRPTLERLASVLNGLRDEVGALRQEKPVTARIDLSSVTTQIEELKQAIRQRPEYRMSRYVQYGMYSFGVLVVLLVISVGYGLHWRNERNAFEASDWKWRNLRQVDPVYVAQTDSVFAAASQAEDGAKLAGYYAWIVQQEQADATREAARKAAEQAKAMNAQADELEGKKKRTK